MASDFITEKIKDKPINKRRLILRVLFTAVLAVIFGVVSALVYSITMRELTRAAENSELNIVNIPPDEDPVLPEKTEAEEDTPEMSVSADSEEASEAENDPVLPVSQNEAVSADEADEKLSGQQEHRPQTIITNITNQTKMTPDSYEQLYQTLHETAEEAERSMVTVTGSVSDTDWFANVYENNSQSSGLIIADNNRDLLILTNQEPIRDAENVSVTFCDGKTADAHIIKADTNTDFVMIGVRLNDISEETKEKIKKADLGNSNRSNVVGLPVMAIGNPLGTRGSQAHGLITSNTIEEQMIDRNAHLLTTDIYGSKDASGVIINYSGSVLGIITGQYPIEGTENLITAYAISDMKELIERLANAQDQAYLGIYGTDVTTEAEENLGVPAGAYVTGTVSGSPAMAAGIQSGDVITKFGTGEISDFGDYMDILAKSKPGDEAVISVKRYVRGEYSEMTFEVTLSVNSQ